MPEAIAVPYEETLAADVEHLRFVVHLHPALLVQVIEQPHVVVADEEMQLHARVAHLGQLAQQSHMAAGHHVAVGEPEVEHIAQQEERLAVVLDAVEPTA